MSFHIASTMYMKCAAQARQHARIQIVRPPIQARATPRPGSRLGLMRMSSVGTLVAHAEGSSLSVRARRSICRRDEERTADMACVTESVL
jgi:hypothetical protein